VSLIRQWTWRPEFWVEIPPPVTQPASAGVPSFLTLDPFRPRSAAMVHGAILSIALFCLTCFAIRYSWIRLLHVHIPEVQFEAPQWIPPIASPTDFRGRATEPAAQQPAVTPGLSTPPPQPVEAASGPASNPPTPPADAAKAAENRAAQSSAAGQSKAARTSPALEPYAAAAQPLATKGPTTFTEDTKLDAAARHRVIDGAIAIVTKYYVDPDVAQRMAIAIRKHENDGDDEGATDAATFADLLTSQMRDVSHDTHVVVTYSTATTRDNSPEPTADEVARYRSEMEQSNCTFEKVAILPHNIGYLKFNSFPDASICGPTAASAMAKLNHVDAIIFDLRDNPGGYANMVAFIATYLFDRPTHLNDFYDRSENSTEESWTLAPVPGNKLADKPAFVLTSSTTFSAAEGFSYDLKMLKRATLVGKTTSGRGHMGAEHRIDDHFTIRVPSMKVINPISRTNWEGTGVEPDVKVKAADALKAAIDLAERKLQKK
jgi:peptidase S41-like protein